MFHPIIWIYPGFLGAAILLATLPRCDCTSAESIIFKPHSEGYTDPTNLVIDPVDSSRFFVVERGGLIRIVSQSGGQPSDEPFLDVSEHLGVCNFGYCTETGLLGLAFHPNYATNGKFYLDYTQYHPTETFEGGVDWCSDQVLTSIVAEFTVDPFDSSKADPDSLRELLTFNQPYCNHNGGGLAFSPLDGYLYITSGDGGDAGDPQGNSQNTQTMLGKLLRIDVDTVSDGKNYGIPPSNPFVEDPNVLDEIWAYGLRNPWRISFDTERKDLYIADVGQYLWEEVNFQIYNSGGGQNYGWSELEGTHCYVEGCDKENPEFTSPILEYSHEDGSGCSITGGHVHRGSDERLNGRYFYGDYCSGKVWSTRFKNGEWKVDLMHSGSVGDGETERQITSFGQDAAGDLYVVEYGIGQILKIESCVDNRDWSVVYQGNEYTCAKIARSGKKLKACEESLVQENCIKTCDMC